MLQGEESWCRFFLKNYTDMFEEKGGWRWGLLFWKS
jgi:hypothetical protein